MRQVIIVLIALLAISIFMPAIMAKQGNTQPFLASATNMSKVTTMPKADSETTIPGITSTLKNFINGTTLAENYKDVMNNNNAARSSSLAFLAADWTPIEAFSFPAPTPTVKLHQMN
ncbi:MAG: hypothetical protein ACE14P_10520 [Methanotrichaceae archaeon]